MAGKEAGDFQQKGPLYAKGSSVREDCLKREFGLFIKTSVVPRGARAAGEMAISIKFPSSTDDAFVDPTIYTPRNRTLDPRCYTNDQEKSLTAPKSQMEKVGMWQLYPSVRSPLCGAVSIIGVGSPGFRLGGSNVSGAFGKEMPQKMHQGLGRVLGFLRCIEFAGLQEFRA